MKLKIWFLETRPQFLLLSVVLVFLGTCIAWYYNDAFHPGHALLAFLGSAGVLDAHAADQLLTLAALCPHKSHFSTTCITDHLLTNAAVIRQLTGREVTLDGRPGCPGAVTVEEA